MSKASETASTEAFNRELFDRRFDGFELSERERARIEWTLRHVPAGVRTILDVGAGHGGLTNRLAQSGYRVTGLDLSAVSLKRLRACRTQGSALSLPFKAGSFDLVICAEVIEHLSAQERRRCLDELWRVAGQSILITTPDNEDLEGNLVKCDRCGAVFNAWGHVASFDENALRELLPAPPRVVDVYRCVEPAYLPCLRHVRHKVLHTYGYADDLVCPSCLNDHIQPPTRGLLVRVVDRINFHLGAKRRSGWLLGVWNASPGR